MTFLSHSKRFRSSLPSFFHSLFPLLLRWAQKYPRGFQYLSSLRLYCSNRVSRCTPCYNMLASHVERIFVFKTILIRSYFATTIWVYKGFKVLNFKIWLFSYLSLIRSSGLSVFVSNRDVISYFVYSIHIIFKVSFNNGSKTIHWEPINRICFCIV